MGILLSLYARPAGLQKRVAVVSGIPYTSVMSEAGPRPVGKIDRPTLDVPRLDTGASFRKEAYAALKRAITAMDIYGHAHEIRLDERRLSDGLGVSRTPIREAMTLLEQEGFVRTRPRRGIYVVRKTKREIVEMITVMAALESMAARLAAERAADADIAELRRLMDAFQRRKRGRAAGRIFRREHRLSPGDHQDERLRAARRNDRKPVHPHARDPQDHDPPGQPRGALDRRPYGIIEALERRDPEHAERLAREHTLGLAAHVEQHGDFLDTDARRCLSFAGTEDDNA